LGREPWVKLEVDEFTDPEDLWEDDHNIVKYKLISLKVLNTINLDYIFLSPQNQEKKI
jgi:hypothetical protein